MSNSLLESYLDILMCIKCGGDLHLDLDEYFLSCAECSEKYKIKNMIPLLLDKEFVEENDL
ncbi:MAG: Trm112 family protein [Alphaproteobacteria bacterium]|jgi:uncharacterized protein YbaR (Trm112 family)